jgi:ATP-dependent DNA ligase
VDSPVYRLSESDSRAEVPGVSEHVGGCGDTIYAHACALGAEGIVSKRRDRPYRSGRCPDWVKVKNPDAPSAVRVIER